MSSSLKNKIKVLGNTREERLFRIKIIMYTILGLAVATSIYYLYTVNQEVGIDKMLRELYNLDYNYFTILILLIGIIVPVIVGIYIIAFYISQLKMRMARLERELFFQIIEIKKLIMEIMTMIEKHGEGDEETAGKKRRETAGGQITKEEDREEETEDLETGGEPEEIEEIREAEDNVELLRELLDGLKEMGRELERLRRRL